MRLIGKQAILRENDFVNQSLVATIVMIDEKSNTLLLQLGNTFLDGEVSYKYVVASLRLMETDLSVFVSNRVVSCNVIWVPDEKYNANKPMDTSWWRGGAAAITDVCLK